MRVPSGPAAVLVVVVAAFGCDGIGYDLDTVPLRTLDVRTDASPTDSGHRDTDATDTSIDGVGDMPRTVDAGDVGAVDASDMGNVRACANAFPLAEDAPCNPTQTGECPEDGICTLAVVTTPPPELACLPRSQEGDAGPGEACGRPSDCAENLAWTGH